MTLPAPPAPPPPASAPTWVGPSTWPRPPRWLGLAMILRLARRERRERRLASAAGAIIGLVAGAALAGAFGRGAARPLAAVILLTTAAALADTTDPTQREEAALLIRLGCPRLVIRLAAWLGTMAVLGIPAAVGSWITGLTRAMDVVLHGPAFGDGPGTALVLVAAGAATTSGTRLSENPGGSRAVSIVRLTVRTVAATGLILVGALIPSTSQTGTDLDFTLTVGLFFVIVGFVGIAPAVVLAATGLARHLPWPSTRVAGATLAPQRRGLTITVALVASVAAVLVIQTVLGEGLGAREQARVAALGALGPATVAGSERVVVLDRTMEREFGRTSTGREPPSTASIIPPGATGAAITLLPTEVSAPGGVLGNATPSTELTFGEGVGSVALATPELLRALGLDPTLATGDRAIVLDRRVVGADDQVELIRTFNADALDGRSRAPGVRRPATVAVTGGPWVGVPSVLLPQRVFDDLPAKVRRPRPGDVATTPTDAVLRFPQRPTEAQLEAIFRRAPDASYRLGDERVDLATKDRTDRIGSVWVRTRADAWEAAATLAAVGLAALAVSILTVRLAVRREDRVLAVLGARRRTTIVVSALRATILALAAAGCGTVIALAATWWGIHRYDTASRLDAQVVLAPIGWHVPAAALTGLFVLPALAGALGAAIGWLGPADRRPAGRAAGAR